MTAKIDGTEKEFIAVTGEMFKIQPPNREITENKNLLSIAGKNQGVNGIEVKIVQKKTEGAENRQTRTNLTVLFTERKEIKPVTPHGLATRI